VFDFADRQFKLDAAELLLQHSASAPGSFGYRAVLVAGASVPRVSAASGLFRSTTTGAVHPEDFDVQQAFVSYMTPVGNGLRVDVGKFTTHVGSEAIEGPDGFNDTYSRGLLFGFAEPFTHTGVRLAYGFNTTVSATVLVVNGWDNVVDNNSGKSIGAQIALTPSKSLTFYGNYIGGPERTGSSDVRHLVNLVAIEKPNDAVTFTASVDYGFERNAAGPGQDGRWEGLSASSKVDLTKAWSVALRGEVFADPTAVRTGSPQTLTEATLSPWFKVNAHAIVRADLRLDRSSQQVFQAVDGATNHQFTGAFNVLLTF
jgi:hypothetical protein